MTWGWGGINGRRVVATWLLWAAAWLSPKWSSRETRARGLLAILISSISSQYSASRPTPSPPLLFHKDTLASEYRSPTWLALKTTSALYAVCIHTADGSFQPPFQTPLPLSVFCPYSKLTRLPGSSSALSYCLNTPAILNSTKMHPGVLHRRFLNDLSTSLFSFVLPLLPPSEELSVKEEWVSVFWHSSTSPVLLTQLASEVARWKIVIREINNIGLTMIFLGCDVLSKNLLRGWSHLRGCWVSGAAVILSACGIPVSPSCWSASGLLFSPFVESDVESKDTVQAANQD